MDTAFAAPVTVHRLLVVAYGCQGDLADNAALMSLTRQAATDSGLTVVGDATYAFVPHGLTIALILAQSHLVLSTWPELQVATVDVVACTGSSPAQIVWQKLAAYLRPAHADTSELTISLGTLTR